MFNSMRESEFLADQDRQFTQHTQLKSSDLKQLVYYQKKIRRMNNDLDLESKLYDKNLNKTQTASENKQNYMNNFGVELQIPSKYVLDSNIF